MATTQQIIIGVAAVSTLAAIPMALKLWRSDELLVLKVLTSLVLLIPILGPLIYLLAYRAPAVADADFHDEFRQRTDVLDRWRDRLEASGKLPRRRRWGDRE